MITPLACSLVGQAQPVTIVAGTRTAQLYRAAETTEDYYCNYGVNPAYRRRLEDSGMRVSGIGGDCEVRIVELPDHPFFLATLFLPQTRSTPATPHPLIAGYGAAVGATRRARA